VTAAEIIRKLAAEGGFLRVEGDRLRYHGPARLLTDHLRAVVEDRREELVAFLRKNESELTEEELAALGYRQTLPDDVLDQLLDPRAGGPGVEEELR
jgi:hypothetical protein